MGYLVYDSGTRFKRNDFGKDTITDFSPSQQDKLVLSKTTFAALQSEVGGSISDSDLAVVDNDNQVAGRQEPIVFSQGSNTLFYNQNGAASGLGTGAAFIYLDGISNLNADSFAVAL